jgi:ankyrin repeat protein
MNTIEEIFKNYESAPEYCNGPIRGVHHRGIFGNTPLHTAALQDDPESAKILLEAGADIGALGEDDLTPLLAALELGNARVAEYLTCEEKRQAEQIAAWKSQETQFPET